MMSEKDLPHHFDDSRIDDFNEEKFMISGKRAPYLLVRNVPSIAHITDEIVDLCQKFVNVLAALAYPDSRECMIFVKTMDDVLNLCKGLKSTCYGLTYIIGSYRSRKIAKHLLESRELMENRIYPSDFRKLGVSAMNYQRPQIPACTLLPTDMLDKYFYIADDAHDLERERLHTVVHHTSYQYITGRAYYVISTTTRQNIEQKNHISNGVYNQVNNDYISSDFDEISRCSQFGTCVQCRRDCDVVCKCCDAYYCSVQCQDLGHPSLQTENAIISSDSPELKQNLKDGIQQIPPSGSIVTITTVCKTNIVFIRSKSFDDNMEYFKIVDGLQRIGNSLQGLASDAEVNMGELVVVNAGDEYQRAMIMIGDKSKPLVYLIDYGNLQYAGISSLFRMPSEYVNLPRFTRPVVLKNVPDCYMTHTVRQFMYSYLHNIDVVIRYDEDDLNRDTGIHSVELINCETGESFNELVLNLAFPQRWNNFEVVCFYFDLEIYGLECGLVQLIVLDTSSLLNSNGLFCTMKSYIPEIEKFHSDIQSYCNGLTKDIVYTPRKDEVCLVKCGPKDEWFRGICIKVLGDGYPIIHLIDYGCTMRVRIKNIRRSPYGMDFPVFTHYCEIDTAAAITEEMHAKIVEMLPIGGTICCECDYNSSQNCYKLSLPIKSKLGCLKLDEGSLSVQ